jgi:proton-coupled amino acid transporter
MNDSDDNNAHRAHTYIAGEDAGRLALTAQGFGLDQARTPKWKTFLLSDDTLTAARMHSVGTLGKNERVDCHGNLHMLLTVGRKKKTAELKTEYGNLTDLFVKPQQEGFQEDEEEEEIEEIDIVEGGSLNAAMVGIIKGTVGPAILYLPRGFQLSGYAIAIPSMLFATAMYIYNAHRLLECWKVESDRNHRVIARMEEVRAILSLPDDEASQQQQDYGSTTNATNDKLARFTPALLTYSELARRALGPYSVLVEFGIASMQFGVCLTYLIFVPQNLHECCQELFGWNIPKVYLLLAVIIVEIPLSWIRDIRKLTPTNMLATILIAYGLCFVLVMAVIEGTATITSADGTESKLVFIDNMQSLPAITDAWFMFVGTSFFMMEGSITLLVPLQEAVYRDQDKAKFPMMNQNVTSWIVVFYILFSIVCCAAFGDKIQTALTASLEGSLATTIQLAYSLAVILTFPLQAFPAMEVASKVLGKEALASDVQRNIFATFVTCLLGVIAVCAIDYLGNVVSILGSLFGIPLALVFPPLMHNALVEDSSQARRLMNYGIIVIGFLAMGATSFATIVSWDKGV